MRRACKGVRGKEEDEAEEGGREVGRGGVGKGAFNVLQVNSSSQLSGGVTEGRKRTATTRGWAGQVGTWSKNGGESTSSTAHR